MYYRVERAYLTDASGKSDHRVDSPPYLVAGASALAAAQTFIADDHATLLGTISELPGDKAIATAKADERVYVVFAQRAVEALDAVRS
jgi:hypothetical protein